MYTNDKKLEAIKLRKEGFSYSYISTKISVAKSTLSLWLNDIVFTPNDFTQNIIAQGQKKSSVIKRFDKAVSVKFAIDYANKKIGLMTEKDIFLLGVGIYIGEGSKSGNFVRVANSDPRIIKFAIRWFKECFGLKNHNFKVRIHIYPDNNEKKTLSFWKKELSLSKNYFHPVYIDKRLNKKMKKLKVLPYGTAHLSVVSNGDKNLGVLLHRKILASIDRVLK